MTNRASVFHQATRYPRLANALQAAILITEGGDQ